jgi:hypothetical protein
LGGRLKAAAEAALGAVGGPSEASREAKAKRLRRLRRLGRSAERRGRTEGAKWERLSFFTARLVFLYDRAAAPARNMGGQKNAGAPQFFSEVERLPAFPRGPEGAAYRLAPF